MISQLEGKITSAAVAHHGTDEVLVFKSAAIGNAHQDGWNLESVFINMIKTVCVPFGKEKCAR